MKYGCSSTLKSMHDTSRYKLNIYVFNNINVLLKNIIL